MAVEQGGALRRPGGTETLDIDHPERVHLLGSTLVDHLGAPLRFGSATFLTRAGVHQLLMASTKPAAKEFREWLAAGGAHKGSTLGVAVP